MDQSPHAIATTRLRAHIRPVSSAESLPRSYSTPGNFAGPAPDITDSKLHPALAAFLQAMSEKLDMLVSFASQAQLDSEYTPAEVLEIGTQGLALAKAGDLVPGQHVEVVVQLSQFPLVIISAVGRVSGSGSRQGEPVMLLTFTRIREEDLERIVQFAFREERARIRRTKWGE
jgi:hypothetical protein